MEVENLTGDQLRILGGSLPFDSFDKAGLALVDPTDTGLENSCTPLIDQGFLTYDLSDGEEKFPRGCFKTTQKGWELFLSFRDWKMERVSSKDRAKIESTWPQDGEEKVNRMYLRSGLEKEITVLKQERTKLIDKQEQKIKKQEQKIKQAWSDFKTVWHFAPVRDKLTVLLVVSPVLFLIWLIFYFLVQVILG